MLRRLIGILDMAATEALMSTNLHRVAEPSVDMGSGESIKGFHRAGETSLLPVYQFNARCIHALVPEGGLVVDLGSGSGQFLAYLAEHRPDLSILGVELAHGMVVRGRQMLEERGLARRVQLVSGDMLDFRKLLEGAPVHLVSSVFSLHHLPDIEAVRTCIAEIGRAVSEHQAGVWTFDFARPRRDRTARRFPEVLTPDSSRTFKVDTVNSLRAAWSWNELRAALVESIGANLHSALARGLPLYQVHWSSNEGGLPPENLWKRCGELPASIQEDAKNLGRLFRNVPGQSG